jgi:cation transport ATPase
MRRDIGPPVSSKAAATNAPERGSIPDRAGTAAQADVIGEFRRLLARPAAERSREYRYRFAQSLIFGLPVLGLQWFGPLLSARADEAARWVPLLQAILSGWICYIAALPMLVEGIVVIRESLRADLVVGTLAVGTFIYSVVLLGAIFVHQSFSYRPPLFDWVVMLLIAWNGVRWAWLRRRLGRIRP